MGGELTSSYTNLVGAKLDRAQNSQLDLTRSVSSNNNKRTKARNTALQNWVADLQNHIISILLAFINTKQPSRDGERLRCQSRDVIIDKDLDVNQRITS